MLTFKVSWKKSGISQEPINICNLLPNYIFLPSNVQSFVYLKKSVIKKRTQMNRWWGENFVLNYEQSLFLLVW